MSFLCGALALLIAAALASGLVRPGSRSGARLNLALVAAASLAASVSAIGVLLSGRSLELVLPWPVPGGFFAIGLDPLSAFFLVPVAALSALSACFGVGYLAHAPEAERRGWPAFDALVASMLLVLVARNALLFLVAWEGMSLAAWVLVTGDATNPERRRAGWIFLVAAHVGSAALLLLFAILAHAAGDAPGFEAIRASTALPTGALLALGLVGFGVKAGVIPLHVWLPEAHAAAPSHVSALLSGAMVSLGLYGMLRLAVLLGPLPPATGPTLGALGLAGAWLGVALALQQRDLKRALGYSTVENLGLIAAGLGLAAWASARGSAELAVIGMMAALLHVWGHAAMKGLLFLAAGAAIHGTGTRDLERLGGLMRRMPFTGACFAVGAVAIAGLPPLNGFTGEWLLYRGLLDGGLEASGVARLAAFLATALLALIGGLAAACFVRLLGIAWLGEARHDVAGPPRDEGGWLMRAPLASLLAACVGLAVLPGRVVELFQPVAREVLGPTLANAAALERTSHLLAPLGTLAALCWVALLLLAPLVWRLRARSPDDATWGCGYAAPGPRMQYTSRSFASLFAERLMPRALAPRVRLRAPLGPFPERGGLDSEEGDPLTRSGFEPLFASLAGRFVRLRVLQQGNAHLYLLYILGAVLGSLLWASLRGRGLP